MQYCSQYFIASFVKILDFIAMIVSFLIYCLGCTPNIIGLTSTTLGINSNDVNTPLKNVTLYGIGLEATIAITPLELDYGFALFYDLILLEKEEKIIRNIAKEITINK
jgi:hypothetical protein